MRARYRGEALLIGSLLASGAFLMAFLRMMDDLLLQLTLRSAVLTLLTGLALGFSLLLALFIIYQMDLRAGRVNHRVALFELGPLPPDGPATPGGEVRE